MPVEILEVTTASLLKKFIHLPVRIHLNHKNWVPPVFMDERIYFNPAKNKSFSYSDTILLLAKKNGQLTGRIMGIINNRYNSIHNEHNARFEHFEVFNDVEVSDALLDAIEKWAKLKGVKKLVGPLGFTDKDPQGFLIEGFEEPHVLASHCNEPYVIEFLEKRGYKKETDLVAYQIKVPESVPEFYQRVFKRVNGNSGITILEFESRKKLKPYIKPVFELINQTFVEIYGFSPYEEHEMRDFANRYLPVIDPKLVKVIVNDSNEVVAFIIAMPDISEGIKKANGYVFPTGFLSILKSAKRTRQLNLLLGAIRQDYRNKGLDALMGVKILEEAIKRGYQTIDSHLELETNLAVRAEMERMGGKVYKKFRIFYKDLG